MKNVSLTQTEAGLFLVTLLVPLIVEGVLAVTAFPELRWLLPTSMLFPAGLLAGVAMRGAASPAPVRAGGELGGAGSGDTSPGASGAG